MKKILKCSRKFFQRMPNEQIVIKHWYEKLPHRTLHIAELVLQQRIANPYCFKILKNRRGYHGREIDFFTMDDQAKKLCEQYVDHNLREMIEFFAKEVDFRNGRKEK